jgi:hypothetical protein
MSLELHFWQPVRKVVQVTHWPASSKVVSSHLVHPSTVQRSQCLKGMLHFSQRLLKG